MNKADSLKTSCIIENNMKDLNDVSTQEQNIFINSFDQVLCDVDGVLWLLLESIPGAVDAIKSLKTFGKKILFVSNNNIKSHDEYYQKIKEASIDLEKEDLITPALAMISYFKELNFDKEIYVEGTQGLKKDLENAGLKISKKELDVKNENIGAVIVDIDFHVNRNKLIKTAKFLKNDNILFIAGAPDIKAPIGLNNILTGPGFFHKILIDITGRNPHYLAKPSTNLNEYIIKNFSIPDPSRVLFIGDSISEDMAFAANCGYKKLLVLSGITTKDDLINWKFPEEYKPNYYVNSLKTIHTILSKTTEIKNK